MRHEIKIPNWRPASLNQLMGGKLRDRMRLKKSDRGIIAHYCGDIPVQTHKRRISQHIVLGKGMREYDYDNAWKSLLDGLVKAAVLIDDRRIYVEQGEVTYERNMQWGTTIIIEDIEPLF